MVDRAALVSGLDGPSFPCDPSSLLRFSRNRHDIAYLYRPGHHGPNGQPQAQAGLIPAAFTEAIVTQWDSLVNCVGSDPPDLSTPDTPIPDPLALAQWGTYLSLHTTAQALPSGQVVLRPTATALGTWLWAFTHACPLPPRPTVATAAFPFPQKQAPLAEALHLSPLVLLQYTHMRCHQLAHRFQDPSPYPPQKPDPELADWLTALPPRQPTGQRLLRSLISLVDHLATNSPATPTPISPPVLNQGFLKGYHLCEAADLWLQDIVGQPKAIGTTLLMQGSAQGLAHLLQGWLQAEAPTQL